MADFSLSRFALSVAYTLSIFLLVAGHSYLLEPRPDWLANDDGTPRRGTCRVGHPTNLPQFEEFCPGPCGEDPVFFVVNTPATELRRGQVVNMEWTKNNHDFGFSRFTLVPRASRMDRSAHDKFAFRFSCWDIGLRDCNSARDCGTDEARKKFGAEIEIPTSYPNGEYVLGWSWYGGAVGGGNNFRSEFGDYYSCANIRIVGDDPVTEFYTPKFISGNGKSTCFSTVNRLGPCETEPCVGFQASEMLPAEFDNNQTPDRISARDLGYDGPFGDGGGNENGDGNGNDLNGNDGNGNAGNNNNNNNNNNNENTNGNNAEMNNDNGDNNRAARAEPDGPPSDDGSGDIVKFLLLDTMDGSIIAEMLGNTPNGARRNTYEVDVGSRLNQLTIRAVTDGTIRNVAFSVNGEEVRVERQTPFVIGGDPGGSSLPTPWRDIPKNREFLLVARATDGNGKVDTDAVSVKVMGS